MKTCIILHGSYRSNNFGDVLLMQIFADWIREALDDVDIALPFASDVVRQLVGSDSQVGHRAIRNADGVVFGGGGYFGEPDGNTQRWGLRLIKNHYLTGLRSIIHRVPFAIVGVGAGPITFGPARRGVVHLCNAAVKTAVRDEESLEYLIRYGIRADRVEVTADAAMTINRSGIDEEAREWALNFLSALPGYIRVGIHLSESRGGGPQMSKLKDDIVRLSKYRSDIGFTLIVDHEGARDQWSLADEMTERLGQQANRINYRTPAQLVALLDQMDAVVTTKLHVGIVATALQKVVIAIPKHSKTPRFYRQIGASERCVPLAKYSSGDVINLAEEFVTEGAAFDPPAAIRTLAERNRDVVKQFVRAVASGR